MVLERIVEYHLPRERERTELKFKKMRLSTFSFFRGTPFLFYDWLETVNKYKSPVGLISGDLHFENAGSFYGSDEKIHFDIDDFDEATFAPIEYDLIRLGTSVLLGMDFLKIADERKCLVETFLQAYKAYILNGNRVPVSKNDACPLVSLLLKRAKNTHTEEFIEKRVNLKEKKIIIDGQRSLITTDDDKGFVKSLLKSYDFDVKDVARAVSGNGSMGLARYLCFVNIKGKPRLIDVKEASVASCNRFKIKDFASSGERINFFATNILDSVPSYFGFIDTKGKSFLIKEKLPTSDRVNLKKWNGDGSNLHALVVSYARLAANSHLSNFALNQEDYKKELLDFVLSKDYIQYVVDRVLECEKVFLGYYKEFANNVSAG